MVIPPRIERGTYSLEGCCSIQLSYGIVITIQRNPLGVELRDHFYPKVEIPWGFGTSIFSDTNIHNSKNDSKYFHYSRRHFWSLVLSDKKHRNNTFN